MWGLPPASMASDTRYDKLHVRAGGIKHSPLAGYDIGPVVGIGTYGEVRCASHSLSRKRVAIKIVDLSRFGDDARKIIQKEVVHSHWVEVGSCVIISGVVPYGSGPDVGGLHSPPRHPPGGSQEADTFSRCVVFLAVTFAVV